MPASPEHSLLLTKATGTMAHAGGKRMEIGSDEYKLARRWIASGTPYGSEKDPIVTKITVHPENRVLPRNNRQQFAVYAHYSDGSVLDVTQRAQFESNDQEVAMVDGAGLVRTLDLPGEAGIMARYQATGSPLLSGYLLGEQFLNNRAAALDVSYGKGHIVLLGFRPQWRGQPFGTFRVVFNAVMGLGG